MDTFANIAQKQTMSSLLPEEAIAIIGAGPAGLMAADRLAHAGRKVILFERMPSPARKFLMAGRGGLNLTHSEPLESFISRYGAAAGALEPAVAAFPPEALRALAQELGEPTFTGSSGRVFPKSFKASPLLRAWLHRLGALGVDLQTRHTWLGWTEAGALRFATPAGEVTFAPQATILALGGASWPRLGADGSWVDLLRAEGIAVAPLVPANMGVLIPWSPVFRERSAGEPLKRVAMACRGAQVRGEAMVTQTGLEGGAVYALSRAVRVGLEQDGYADLVIDLRPDATETELADRLGWAPAKQSFSTRLRKAAGLSPAAVGLLREAVGPAVMTATPAALARATKSLRVRVTGIAGLERAISTAGGIEMNELDAGFMLWRRPGVFACGEMLDWEAPTGGYLLQASFSTGRAAAEGVLAWTAARTDA